MGAGDQLALLSLFLCADQDSSWQSGAMAVCCASSIPADSLGNATGIKHFRDVVLNPVGNGD